MTDIVERLRGIAAERKARGSGATTTIDPNITGWLGEAADEIERLRAALSQYGDHTYECSMKDTVGRCTCGYSNALGLNE